MPFADCADLGNFLGSSVYKILPIFPSIVRQKYNHAWCVMHNTCSINFKNIGEGIHFGGEVLFNIKEILQSKGDILINHNNPGFESTYLHENVSCPNLSNGLTFPASALSTCLLSLLPLPVEAYGELFKGQGSSTHSTALSTNGSECINSDGII